jgi:hypothetical protein
VATLQYYQPLIGRPFSYWLDRCLNDSFRHYHALHSHWPAGVEDQVRFMDQPYLLSLEPRGTMASRLSPPEALQQTSEADPKANPAVTLYDLAQDQPSLTAEWLAQVPSAGLRWQAERAAAASDRHYRTEASLVQILVDPSPLRRFRFVEELLLETTALTSDSPNESRSPHSVSLSHVLADPERKADWDAVWRLLGEEKLR